MNRPALSLVIPAWNEAARIGGTLDRVLADADRLGIAELIVVDDGSTDDTAAIVRRHATAHPDQPIVRLLHSEVNRGKGAALRMGLLAATSPLVAFLDADLSIGPASFEAARNLIADGADVVVGYRISFTGQADGRGQPPLRRLLSILFKRAQRQIVGLPVRDTQCPFKVFTRESIAQTVPACHSDGWAFDVEVLLVAARAGLRIAELPVDWHFVGGSTVKANLATVWSTLRDLFRVRRTHGAA